MELAAEVMEDAKTYVPALAGAQIETATVCIRSLPLDGLPIMGWVPGVDGLYVIAAHAAVTLAPALAELAVIEVAQEGKAEMLESYRPNRFL
jgi:glycine/D-amino acid oxidase-like deaminating enzyme